MTELHKFGPKSADHFAVGKPCPACQILFKAGDYTTLVPLGPGDDPKQQEKAAQGRSYIAVATEVHWECSGGKES